MNKEVIDFKIKIFKKKRIEKFRIYFWSRKNNNNLIIILGLHIAYYKKLIVLFI